MAKDQQTDSTSDLHAKLASPARRALDTAGITQLDQLTAVTEAEVAALHGMGPKALDQLRDAMAARGHSFRDAKADS